MTKQERIIELTKLARMLDEIEADIKKCEARR